MTLAQVQAAVAVVVTLIGTWAGLLIAVALLLPQQTAKAEQALEESPKRCFFSGIGMLLVTLVGAALLTVPAPLIKLVGLCLLLGIGALVTVGAAGIAQLMGKRIGEMSGARTSFGALVRGSTAFSLALGFPLIGWYVFAPITILCALGAGLSAFRSQARSTSLPIVPPGSPEFDVAKG